MFELPLPPLKNEFGRAQRDLAAQFHVLLIPKRLLIGMITGEAPRSIRSIFPQRGTSRWPSPSGGSSHRHTSDNQWTRIKTTLAWARRVAAAQAKAFFRVQRKPERQVTAGQLKM